MLKLSKYTKIINNDKDKGLIIFNTYNGNRSRLFDEKFIELANKLKKGTIRMKMKWILLLLNYTALILMKMK